MNFRFSIIFLTLFMASCLGDKFVFRPDKKQKFENCVKADQLNLKTINEKIENSKEHIRYYYFEDENPRAIVLMFHGNGASACNEVALTEKIKKSGVNYAFVEYPGYAGDKIKPTQDRILNNVLKVFEHFQKNNHDNLPIYAHGVSLGTGIATFLASKVDLEGLILHAPYTSIARVGDHLSPFKKGYIKKFTFEAFKWAPKVTEPVLIINTKTDSMIPYEMSLEQENHFTNASTKRYDFEEGDHYGIIFNNFYWEEVLNFIQ